MDFISNFSSLEMIQIGDRISPTLYAALVPKHSHLVELSLTVSRDRPTQPTPFNELAKLVNSLQAVECLNLIRPSKNFVVIWENEWEIFFEKVVLKLPKLKHLIVDLLIEDKTKRYSAIFNKIADSLPLSSLSTIKKMLYSITYSIIFFFFFLFFF